MSRVFFDELDIPKPDYNLEIAGLAHGAMTGRMLEKIERVLLDEKPDVVLVYGDTNSTLAGALAAVKLHIQVTHVEAGLRSFNRRMPEEHNRVLTDHCSDLLFCSTKTAVKNLQNEGITEGVYNVGDVMYDAALYYAARSRSPELPYSFNFEQPFALATVHWAENTDKFSWLKSIFNALAEIGSKLPVLMPIHPRTRKKLVEAGVNRANVYLADPVGYLEMVYLLQHCNIVLTDSGGLQKEAFFFRKPCITLREETEWVETVEAGWNVVVGADREKFVKAVRTVRTDRPRLKLYGDGNAAKTIIHHLSANLNGSPS